MSERSDAKRTASAAQAGASDGVVENAGAGSGVASAEQSEGIVRDIPVSAIEPDPTQPRRVFDEEKLSRLAESIRRYGLL